jgi:hypothetical protein
MPSSCQPASVVRVALIVGLVLGLALLPLLGNLSNTHAAQHALAAAVADDGHDHGHNHTPDPQPPAPDADPDFSLHDLMHQTTVGAFLDATVVCPLKLALHATGPDAVPDPQRITAFLTAPFRPPIG